ncbi:MAG: hypothetical protein HY791_09500 [Deltaproteobacteria bacterium]|nr:hypothetical protein [Deltaproteobacteria bacterium]
MNRFCRGAAGLWISAVIGCSTELESQKPQVTSQPEQPSEVMFSDHWTPVDVTVLGPVVVEPPAVREGRRARRLSVDQLRRSIPSLLGEEWTARVGREDQNAFDVLSGSLGEADYLAVTAENREPSPLFAKFMDDMAGQVCSRAVQADALRSVDQRLVIPYSDDVNRNLRFLRLKLHGIYVPESSLEGLDELRALFDEIQGVSDVESAWVGVCVAMLTAPEMMAY